VKDFPAKIFWLPGNTELVIGFPSFFATSRLRVARLWFLPERRHSAGAMRTKKEGFHKLRTLECPSGAIARDIQRMKRKQDNFKKCLLPLFDCVSLHKKA
jgi:hypothetical protein